MAKMTVDAYRERNYNVIIIAVAIVALATIVLYYRDRQQQSPFELRRLEKRVELLEEWGMPRRNAQ
ncbi:MAG: hypothetical protein KAV87_10360 [Desulfobacteraceae bacterium]|nr:hypothetical protein [Desulfobacteraceae bacterium]